MTLYQEPTKYKPLLFFQTFLRKENFNKYESSFYEYPINASQVSSRIEGYIEYSLNEYNEGDNPLQRIYFKDQLEKLLDSHFTLTCKLLEERESELLYQNDNPSLFVNKQLSQLNHIKKEVSTFPYHKPQLLKHLKEIELQLNKLLANTYLSIKRPLKKNTIYSSYFGTKVSGKVLGNLYNISINLDMIDSDNVTKDEFITVFTSPNPKEENAKIIFNKDNRSVIFYLNTLKPLFNNFSVSRLSSSKAFYNKSMKLLNENDINKVNHFLKQSETTKYYEITEALRPLLSQIK